MTPCASHLHPNRAPVRPGSSTGRPGMSINAFQSAQPRAATKCRRRTRPPGRTLAGWFLRTSSTRPVRSHAGSPTAAHPKSMTPHSRSSRDQEVRAGDVAMDPDVRARPSRVIAAFQTAIAPSLSIALAHWSIVVRVCSSQADTGPPRLKLWIPLVGHPRSDTLRSALRKVPSSSARRSRSWTPTTAAGTHGPAVDRPRRRETASRLALGDGPRDRQRQGAGASAAAIDAPCRSAVRTSCGSGVELDSPRPAGTSCCPIRRARRGDRAGPPTAGTAWRSGTTRRRP